MNEISEIEGLTLASYVKSSKYRLKVMDCLSEYPILIPTEISKKTGIHMNHISNVLKQLKNKKLIVCINEEVKKGRLYKITELGVLIVNDYLTLLH